MENSADGLKESADLVEEAVGHKEFYKRFLMAGLKNMYEESNHFIRFYK